MQVGIWASREAKNMDLKDLRRNKTAARILERLCKKPSVSIPEAFSGDNSGIKATYRFLENDALDEQDILSGHYKSTLENITHSTNVINFICDGMDISLNNLKKTEGLGFLSNHIDSLGIKTQNTLALNDQLMPLGLILQEYWIRDPKEYGKKKQRAKKPLEEKETYYWIKSIDQIENILPINKAYNLICDGGADIFDILIKSRRKNSNLLIHLVQNRNLVDEDVRLFAKLDEAPILGIISKKLERTKSTPERTVQLEVRTIQAEISKPINHKKSNVASPKVSAILVQEISSDIEVKDKILWRLLSTETINSLEDTTKLVELYSKRWLIERFHYILKEGCNIEKLQLEHYANIKRAVALYSIVAFRIMNITYLSRIEPDSPCTKILSEDEWKALWCYHHKNPKPPHTPPTINQATRLLAKLGGFMGRKGDGEPGTKVLWRGFRNFESIVQAYLIFKG